MPADPGDRVRRSANRRIAGQGRRRRLGPDTVLRLRPGHQLCRYDETLRVRAFGKCCLPLIRRRRSGQVTRPVSLLSGPGHSRSTDRARVTKDIPFCCPEWRLRQSVEHSLHWPGIDRPGLLPAVHPGAGRPSRARLLAPPGAGPRRAQRVGDGWLDRQPDSEAFGARRVSGRSRRHED